MPASPPLTRAIPGSVESTPDAPAPIAIWGHLALIPVALGVWAASLPFADVRHLDNYGLLPRLPMTFLLAVGALCVGFVVAVRHRGRPAERLAMLYLVALVLTIYATIPALYAEPRYAFVYKHIAVVHYIEVHGSIDRGIDIYQNWPGFFALNAMLSQVTGVDALRYANWTQVLFPLADLFALRFVFAGLTTDRRRINIALLIFLLGSWVEYGYLAPQSLALFLTLVIMGIVLRWLHPVPGQWHLRVLDTLGRKARAAVPRWTPKVSAPYPAEPEEPAVPTAVAVALVLALTVAIVTSHQLTPFFLVLNLTLLVLGRRCRTWWLPLAVVVLTVGWIALGYDYLADHFPTLLGGNPVANAQTSNHPSPGIASEASRFIALAARALTLAMGVAALVGAWRDHRSGKRQNLVLALAAAPALLISVQSYGGEGVYRIYMFMMPWLAYLAAATFASTEARLGRGRTAALLVGSLLCGTLFLTAYYGLERENYIPRQEVAASEWFDANSPPGSMLMLMIQNDPYPVGPHYDTHLAQYGHYAEDVLTNAAWANPLTKADVGRLHDFVLANGPKTYLSFSPSQIAYAENHGYTQPGTLASFMTEVLASKQFSIVFHQKDVYILRPIV